MKKKIFAFFSLAFVLAACQKAPSEAVKSAGGLRPIEPSASVSPASLSAEPSLTAYALGFVSISLSNDKESRPQTGLSDALVAYEKKSDGGSSRILALYRGSLPEFAGPLAEASPSFLHLSEEWGASHAFSGSSQVSAAFWKKFKVSFFDAKSNSKFFYRDNSMAAPLNVYAKPSLIPLGSPPSSGGILDSSSAPFSRGDKVLSVSLSFGANSNVKFEYSPKEAVYFRFQEGKPNEDKITKKSVFANALILQYVSSDEKSNPDSLIGKGNASYFFEGKKIDGSWVKEYAGTPTKFLDGRGKAVSFAPGKLWIEIVEPEVKIRIE